ncbi:MAG TPA: hypothetical protein DGF30_12600 [Desulfomicrobium sp.]|nr:hypothetical protein [Desulfomicrobium sp.]
MNHAETCGCPVVRGGKLLLVDPAGVVGEASPEDCAFSTMQCLERTAGGRESTVAVVAGSNEQAQRFALPDLVGMLKRSVRVCRVVAVVSHRHRMLLESFRRNGADFVAVMNFGRLDAAGIEEAVMRLGAEDSLERQLALVCPFLNYSAINARTELTVCGAYRNRMVLGPQRLRSCCETASHAQCGQFLTPRCDA